jgi:hypothetical protein
MVAMSIAMIVIAGILSSYTYIGRNLVRNSNQQGLEIQSRRALQWLGRDIQCAVDVTTYSSSQLTLLVPKQDAAGNVLTDGSGQVMTKAVTYTYDSAMGTLSRVDPDFEAGAPFTLLRNLSLPAGTGFFTYLDQQDLAAENRLSIKKIEVAFSSAQGAAQTGTRSTYTAASARFILRNKHLVVF